MTRRRGRIIEVDTLEQFDALTKSGVRRMRGWRLQELDLRTRTGALLALDPHGSVFLGCTLADDAVESIRSQGGLIFPTFSEVPFQPYRHSLYSPEELYAGIRDARYSHTPDAEIYAWSRQGNASSEATLARTVHDHSIDHELDALLRQRHCVGVMGGHRVERGDGGYREAAELGRSLTRSGLFVASGGGPGAMEAANLGAYLSDQADGALDDAVELLSRARGFRPSITEWARAAFEVRDRWSGGGSSLGIPTWFYGHEPPNAFASLIAKFFQNALREDTLLRRCDAGIVFLPGAAGTVQEIFQDACENYYAEGAMVAPMILVGERYWNDVVPVWPLLTALGDGRDMQKQLHLVDSVSEAVSVLTPR